MTDGPPGLLAELQRRKVFRVAAAYAAAAFVVLQGADLLAAGLFLPPWVFTSLTILAIAGFPVAVVLAWVYERTPSGIRRTAAPPGGRLPLAARLGVTVTVAAVTLGAGGWWAARSLYGADDALRVLAVLPFDNIAADSADTYFASGLRLEIMDQLSKVSELRLMGAGAVAAVADSPDRVARLATELGVGSVVEGSVRIADRRARVSVQLNDARTGRTLWSEQYDRDLTDVLGVQSDVALRVARALHARVSRDERERVQALPTGDPVAYELFLRARETWAINRDALITTAGLLRQAIRRDPEFAPAHAALARVHLFLAYQGVESAVDSGLVAVHRALTIDSTLAAAHQTHNGLLSMQGRLREALRAGEKGLAFDPNHVGSLLDYSLALSQVGRFDESLRWAEEGLKRTPNLANSYYHVGIPLLLLADDAATERFMTEGLDRQPAGYHRVHVVLAGVEAYSGRIDAALARARAEAAAKPGNFEVRMLHSEVASLAGAPEADSLLEALFHSAPDGYGWMIPHPPRTRYAALLLSRGETERAQRLLDSILSQTMADIEAGTEVSYSRVEVAAVHALRGDPNTALDWLDRSYEAGNRDFRGLTINPLLASLRDEPRFLDLITRMERDVAAMRARAAAASDLL